MTTWPASISVRMVSISTMALGLGEATQRRQPRPASSMTQLPRRRISSASFSVMNVPMGLEGFWKAGSAGSTSTWVRTVATGFWMPRFSSSSRREFCRS